MVSFNTINVNKLFSSHCFIAILTIACIAIVSQFQSVGATSDSTGLIVPLYSYPGATWDELIQEKNNYPSVPIVAIINPDNGPGTKDPNYISGVQKLQAAGITVLGYVYTQGVDATEIRNYMGDYKNWYNVNGIFFDAMYNTSGKETFYKQLSDYARSIGLTYTVGNPGTDTLPTYVGTVDNLVIHDGPHLPLISSLGGWHQNFTKTNFSIISYDVDSINKTYVENATQYVQYLYVTDSISPNPFNNIPNYIGNLLGMLNMTQKQNNTSVSIMVNALSTDGSPLNGLWTTIQSDKNTSSGFTPFSFTAVKGNKYSITVSNFGNYTFEHWDDNTTNTTRIVVPTENVTLTAYYGIKQTMPTNNTVPLNTPINNTAPLNTPINNTLSSNPIPVPPVQISRHAIVQSVGSIAVNVMYTGGDRADYSFLSFKVYQDSNKTAYEEISSVSSNPFDIKSLPLNHLYKIEVFANGMCSDIEYADLEKPNQEIGMYLPPPGGLRPHIFYNDGYTPISNATVIIKSQDNKTWSTGSTDVYGETLRFWLEPTSVKNNYFIIQVQIGQHISYSYSPAFLYPGYAQEISVTTPWPPIVNSVIAVKVYDKLSKLFSPEDGIMMVDLFDDHGTKIAESKVNPRGEVDFGNLKVGDYMFRALEQNGTEWGETNATIDGTKTSFSILEDKNMPVNQTGIISVNQTKS